VRIPTIAAAAILLATPGLAQSAEPPCLTRAEFTGLASYALPSAIDGVNARCESVLGPSAFLPTGGDALVKRYEANKDTNWPAAKSAFLKFSTKNNGKPNGLLKLLSDDALRDIIDAMIVGLVSEQIKTEKCGTIDETVRLLSPLPPENTSGLIAPILILIGKPNREEPGVAGRFGKFAICQET